MTLADKLRDHFIKLGFRTSWDFYGNDVIIDIVTNSESRERAEENPSLSPEEWEKDSTSITIWVESDTLSIFIDDDAQNRVFNPTEEDINKIISKVEQIIF